MLLRITAATPYMTDAVIVRSQHSNPFLNQEDEARTNLAIASLLPSALLNIVRDVRTSFDESLQEPY